jgi:hypothetical protein
MTAQRRRCPATEEKIMKRQPLGLYAIALAVLVVGLIALGIPASTLLFGAFVLGCPLMMMFMMSGMHTRRDQSAAVRDSADQSPPTAIASDPRPTGVSNRL